jgi:hypothetical protein
VNWGDRRDSQKTLWGTDGSNPSPSSGESCANLTWGEGAGRRQRGAPVALGVTGERTRIRQGAARPVADTEGFSAPHAARDDQRRGPYDHLGSVRPALRQARGSDEAAIFAGKLAIRVMLASLISQPRRFREGADLIAGVISI